MQTRPAPPRRKKGTAKRLLAPAAGIAPATSSTDTHPDRIPKGLFVGTQAAAAIAKFEQEIGGRQVLLDAVLLSPDLTPEMEDLLGALVDDRLKDEPLARLCAGVGLRPGAVLAAFRDADMGRASLQSLRKIADKLPAVTAQVLLAAVDHEQICGTCRGDRQETILVPAKGKSPEHEETRTCRTCKGRGTIYVEADPDRQDRVLEMAGLLQKGGGISINQSHVEVANQTAVTVDAAGGLAQLQQAVSGILFSRTAQAPASEIDVEPAPAEDPSLCPR